MKTQVNSQASSVVVDSATLGGVRQALENTNVDSFTLGAALPCFTNWLSGHSLQVLTSQAQSVNELTGLTGEMVRRCASTVKLAPISSQSFGSIIESIEFRNGVTADKFIQQLHGFPLGQPLAPKSFLSEWMLNDAADTWGDVDISRHGLFDAQLIPSLAELTSRSTERITNIWRNSRNESAENVLSGYRVGEPACIAMVHLFLTSFLLRGRAYRVYCRKAKLGTTLLHPIRSISSSSDMPKAAQAAQLTRAACLVLICIMQGRIENGDRKAWFIRTMSNLNSEAHARNLGPDWMTQPSQSLGEISELLSSAQVKVVKQSFETWLKIFASLFKGTVIGLFLSRAVNLPEIWNSAAGSVAPVIIIPATAFGMKVLAKTPVGGANSWLTRQRSIAAVHHHLESGIRLLSAPG